MTFTFLGFKRAMISNMLAFCLVLSGMSISSSGFANYLTHPQSSEFIDQMVGDHGFERQQLERWLASAKKKQSILDAISRPAEKRLTWSGYSKIFIKPARIAKGKSFMEAYAAELSRAEEEYGVPREIITAIIGVETRYGENKGSYRVIDALSTLGFDYPPRSKFFRKELGQVLLLAREQGFDPLALKGSYAGAMGYGQFIPSSYRHYAVDFDGDAIADILDNPIDAIGSVANYFARHKWKAGEGVAFEATFDTNEYKALIHKGLKPKFTMADMQSVGLQNAIDIPDSDAAKIQILKGENGEELWVTQHNFYVITRYNHSHLYAMAVYQLAKALGLDS